MSTQMSIKRFLLSICLVLLLVSCGTMDQGAQKASALKGRPDPISSGPVITGLDTGSSDGQTRVDLQANIPLTYTAFYQQTPPAIIIDVSAKLGSQAPNLTRIDNRTVGSIEMETIKESKDMSRVTINLTQATTYNVVPKGQSLVIMIDEAPNTASLGKNSPSSAPAAALGTSAAKPAQPKAHELNLPLVTSVDFKPVGKTGRSQLVIRTNKPISPQIITKDSGRTVILSLGPADIIKSVNQTYAAMHERSAVKNIMPHLGQNNILKFLINLNEAVPYHLGQQGLETYLDFDSATDASVGRSTAVKTARVDNEQKIGYRAADQDQDKSTGVQQATETPAPRKVYSGRKVSLDFQNADVHNIIRLLGEVAGKNVVISDAVKGKVTLKLKSVPWDQAMDVVLNSNKLGMVETASVIRVDTKANLLKEQDLKIEEQAREQKQEAAMPLVKKIYTPKYRPATEISQELLKYIQGGAGVAIKGTEHNRPGRITVIGNDIFVEATVITMPLLDDIFRKLDIPTQQILIEARIVEASSNFTRQLGMNWGGFGGNTVSQNRTPTDPGEWLVGGLMGAGGAAVNVINPVSYGLGLGFSLIQDNFILNAELYAMEQAGEGRVISSPRIMASNDQSVTISQGKSIPYETPGDINTPPKITFKQANLQLTVKPHLEQNGKIITMDIKVQKDTPDPTFARNPPIDTRMAETKLMVKNGETVVIGGIVTDSKAKRVNRVPGLHRLPLLGWLFQNYEITDDKVELLIFLTTNIIPVLI